jgi:EAL domain-containing protein (putative c-di-GMP-specific phosphodiesterase class I)
VKDQEFSINVLKRLKGIGVAIAIDDFGTGYSSLSYLKRFPVDYVKIDQSFVQDVATDPDATSLVTAIINMAHSLNLKTIAEGVETEDQWKILRLLKCDMAQGYYFSAALPPKDVEKFLQ